MRKRKRLSDKVQTSYRDVRDHQTARGDTERVWWYLGFLVKKGYADHLLLMEDLTEEERNFIKEKREES